MATLAFDTSNYTTSIALLDGEKLHAVRRLLPVAQGEMGLRQSQALFHHVKALPELMEELTTQVGDFPKITTVGVSTRPRGVEGSYMPCFLAGESMARSIATLHGATYYQTSHQQGHLAAALWSLGRLDLMDQPFFAWHLSGGTTELLQVAPQQGTFAVEQIGGSSDISAGQLVDRTGGKLGFEFPSGREVSQLAGLEKGSLPPYPLKLEGLSFSLSGMENKVDSFLHAQQPHEDICRFVLDTLAKGLQKTTRQAREQFGNLPTLYCGGVASSQRLRQKLGGGLFPEADYCTDNAVGVAVLAQLATQAGETNHG